MDKMKAITFFDLDGTLLDGTSQITPEITAAVAALKDNQILPLIATGRTL
ncbi:HAD hydrolase family protein, partial [Enterococcus faecalis]